MLTRSRTSGTRILAETDLRAALERSGLRFTRQRAAVYRYFQSAESHPTAEEVYHHVRRQEPKISLATIYKALDALVAAGLLTKITSADGPSRYDCRGDAHYHLYCQDTGQLHDLPTPYDPRLLEKLDPQLVETLRRKGFHVTGYRLELLCVLQPE